MFLSTYLDHYWFDMYVGMSYLNIGQIVSRTKKHAQNNYYVFARGFWFDLVMSDQLWSK